MSHTARTSPPNRSPAGARGDERVDRSIVGLAAHVLHHVGFLVGTAFVAGSGGTALFGSVGARAPLPLLWRLCRRFHTWRAPAIGVAVFAAMFAFSTLVIGPAITGSSGPATPSPPAGTHQGYH